jgi:hypothetical protein
MVEVDGAVVNGVQSTITSTNITAFKDTLDAVVGGTYSNIPSTTADAIPYVDSVTSNIQWTSISDLFDEAIVTGSIIGSLTNLTTTTNATALTLFDTDFRTSTAALTATAGNTGITTFLPSKFDVIFTGSLKAALNDQFSFQVYAGGSPYGRVVVANGISTARAVNFTVIATTDTLSVLDEIEIRVFDGGDEITELGGSLRISFAGL